MLGAVKLPTGMTAGMQTQYDAAKEDEQRYTGRAESPRSSSTPKQGGEIFIEHISGRPHKALAIAEPVINSDGSLKRDGEGNVVTWLRPEFPPSLQGYMPLGTGS